MDAGVLGDDIPKVQSNSNLDLPVRNLRCVAIVKCTLDVDGTAGSFEGAGKLYEETVTHGFDLPSAMLPKRLPQQLAVFVQKFESDCLVFLRQRAVAYHVGEHDRRQPSALLRFFVHQSSRGVKSTSPRVTPP